MHIPLTVVEEKKIHKALEDNTKETVNLMQWKINKKSPAFLFSVPGRISGEHMS